MTTTFEQWTMPGGRTLYVHRADLCRGETCVIHKPTAHRMRDWPLCWRNDRKIFERTCPHGAGHPDPDQCAYWDSIGESFQSVHCCDGCCTDSALA